MLNPDQVVAALTALVIQNTLNGSHVLAGDVLIHDDELRVPVLALTPQLIDDVLVAAVGVTAHDHTLVETGQVAHCFFLILGLKRLGEVQRLHLDQNVDAPAVCSPV